MAIFQNKSVINEQKGLSNIDNKTSLHVENVVNRYKEKEVIKRKTYKRTEIYSIKNNITRKRNDTVAINNSTNNPTQLLQNRLQLYRKFFIQQRQKRKLHDELSKPKNLTITCPEIGNYTFTNDPPFNVLGIPQCGDKVKPQFRYI